MTGKGHILSGVAISIGVYFYAKDVGAIPFITTVFMLFGSTAPDWLEIRSKNGGTLIKHRTITHWLPLWLGLFFFNYWSIENSKIFFEEYAEFHKYFYSAFLGFSIGGLLHLLVDLPNPMGIPILTPYHRFSLKLWKSGKNETFIVIFLFLLSLLQLDLININMEQINKILGY